MAGNGVPKLGYQGKLLDHLYDVKERHKDIMSRGETSMNDKLFVGINMSPSSKRLFL